MTTDRVSPAPPTPTREVRTRVVMGSVMALLAAGLLVGDWQLELITGRRVYPCLLLCVLGMVTLAAVELHTLLEGRPRPPLWLTAAGCGVVLLSAWPAHLGWTAARGPLGDVALAFAGVVIFGFLHEMWRFREPDGVVIRLALLTWVVAYLGLLPTFFVSLRWWDHESALAGVTALTLVIFVPKCGDIGAFFTGRALGRHRMCPVLSPKKT